MYVGSQVTWTPIALTGHFDDAINCVCVTHACTVIVCHGGLWWCSDHLRRCACDCMQLLLWLGSTPCITSTAHNEPSKAGSRPPQGDRCQGWALQCYCHIYCCSFKTKSSALMSNPQGSHALTFETQAALQPTKSDMQQQANSLQVTSKWQIPLF